MRLAGWVGYCENHLTGQAPLNHPISSLPSPSSLQPGLCGLELLVGLTQPGR